jgi:WD40 repeat protein
MKKSIILMLLAVFLFGCSPLQYISIATKPSDAIVYVDNQLSGSTPLNDTITFSKGKVAANIRLTKEGYIDTLITTRYNRGEDKLKTYKSFIVELKAKDVVTIELVSFEPISSSSGIKLNKVITKSLAYLETIERSPTVKSVQRITLNEDLLLQIGEPIISPSSNVLVYWIYTQDETGTLHSNLWKQTVGAQARTRITFGNKLDLFPSFSPDAKFIYFSSNRISNNPHLYKINSQGGGGITSITSTQAEDYSPCVSPQGEIVAYTSNLPTANDPQIWTVSDIGSLPTQLREGQDPQISPDGEQILFLREDKKSIIDRGDRGIFHPRQIWTMKIDGTSPTQLTQNSTYDIKDAKWSPYGDWIVFSSDEGKDLRGYNNYDIWMMRADVTDKTQLTTNGSWDDCPMWSYDEKYIYFRSNRGGSWNIWRFEPLIVY